MFPEVPANWKSLSLDALTALKGELTDALRSFKDAEGEKDYAAARDALSARKAIIAFMAEKAEVDAADLDEPEVELSNEEPEVEEVEEVEEPEEEQTEVVEEPQEVKAGMVKVHTGTGTGAVPGEKASGVTLDKLLTVGGVSKRDPGSQFDGWGDLAETLIDVARGVSPSSTQRFQVAKIVGNFDADHTLSANMVDNLRVFEPEVMAGFCAPTTPTYDLSCWMTDRRPVRNSLQAFKPDNRGSVSIFPSPTMSDLTGQAPNGVGIWTSDDDDSQSGTDPSIKECAVIECATPEVYELYGIWRCLTVQNLLAMTFPELVEAYLNRLAAWHSRVAEIALLEAMSTATVPANVSNLDYGGYTSTMTAILNLLALHEQQERWDPAGMDAWLPRWVKSAIKIDLLRRRDTNGGRATSISDASIDAAFRDVGVDVNWFIDTPTWATAVPPVVTGGNLNDLPGNVDLIIAPKGKFAVMDRGELSIGVTGNGMYRDNNSNAHNNFTFFFENFEAVVNTNSCPAYLLSVDNLCWNGVQIADIAIDCDGGS